MKKLLKRVLGITASVALLVTSSLTAWADGHEHRKGDKIITNPSDGFTITLTTPTDYPTITADNASKFKYGAYQIFSGNVKGTEKITDNPGGTAAGGETTKIPITDIKWGNAFGIVGTGTDEIKQEEYDAKIVGFVIALAKAHTDDSYKYAFHDFDGFDKGDSSFIKTGSDGETYLADRFTDGSNVNEKSNATELRTVKYDKLAVEVADVIAEHNDKREWLQDFADILGGFDGTGGSFTHIGYVSRYYGGNWNTADYKKYEITVPAGYYMILDHSEEGDADEAYSARMLFVAENITQVLKESVPKIDKTILREGEESTDVGHKTDVAGVGDIVTYQLKGTLPSNYNNYTLGYQYKFTDKLSNGLTIQGNEGNYVKVQAKGVWDTTNNKWMPDEVIDIAKTDIKNDTGHTHTIKEAYKDSFETDTLIVEFPCLREIEVTKDTVTYKLGVNEGKTSEIYVTYNAMVDKDAIVGTDGNENKAKLTYSNNPSSYNDTGDTTEEDAIVYTFGLDITKVDAADFLGKGEEASVLDGVKFVIVRLNPDGTANKYQIAKLKTFAAGTTEAPAEEPRSFEDTYYSIDEWTDLGEGLATDGALQTAITTFLSTASLSTDYVMETSEKGNILISGLDVGVKYTMVETEPPTEDYAKINPFTITLTAAKDTKEEYTGKLSGAESDQAIKDGESFSFDNPVDITDTFGDTNNGSANMLVANFKYIDLPSTGGVGTIWFYIFGVAGIALSGVLFFLSKKKVTR